MEQILHHTRLFAARSQFTQYSLLPGRLQQSQPSTCTHIVPTSQGGSLQLFGCSSVVCQVLSCRLALFSSSSSVYLSPFFSHMGNDRLCFLFPSLYSPSEYSLSFTQQSRAQFFLSLLCSTPRRRSPQTLVLQFFLYFMIWVMRFNDSCSLF